VAKEQATRSEHGATREHYDVAIVGGGPAGLSASIWLARYLHRVVLVDSGDPRNWETRGVNGFLGHPDVKPADLRRLGRDEARRTGATLLDGTCDRVTKLASPFTSVRTTTVFTKNPISPSVSVRVRPAIGVPTTTSACPL